MYDAEMLEAKMEIPVESSLPFIPSLSEFSECRRRRIINEYGASGAALLLSGLTPFRRKLRLELVPRLCGSHQSASWLLARGMLMRWNCSKMETLVET